MDTNKYYCRNVTQPAAPTTSAVSATLSGTNSGIAGAGAVGAAAGNSAMQEYLVCGSAHSSAVFSCKELMSRNANSKALLNHRGTNVISGYNGGGGAGSNSNAYCNNNSTSTGNYINVMPVAMGTLQYHRRKLLPQEYQPRLYYNTTDYRCRDDYYSMGATGGGGTGGGVSSRLNTSSPAPLQLQSQQQQSQQLQQQHQQQQQHQFHQQQQQQQHQQQQQQQQHHHQQGQQHSSSSSSSNYHQQQTHYHHQPHQQHQQYQHQQQPGINHMSNISVPQQISQQHQHSTCSPNTALDCIDDAINCSLMSTNNHSSSNSGRAVAAATQTQTHHAHGSATGCEPAIVGPTGISIPGSVPVQLPLPGPPMMYTVHRVVTTAQIQTGLGGNSFTSSSSVSSVVSAVRNEAECLTTAATATGAGANGCHVIAGATTAMGNVGFLGEAGVNGASNSNALANGGFGTVTGLRNSPGLSTNANYLPMQSKCTGIQQHTDIHQHTANRVTNSNCNSTTSSSNTNYISGAKSSSSIPRPLQNVIPTCVYLMSRVAVHMEIEGTTQCPTQVMLAAALGCEELGIANKLLAQSIFGLWMSSTLLEIQLKSHHRPYVVRVAWPSLLEKLSHGNPIEKKFDEPMIILKRNVFFSKRDEEKIKDHRILELLYEEAKQNVLSGRYIMEPVHSLMLGGIQARIELGPYNSHTHTISFFRENQARFLPQHVAKSSNWSWLPVSRKNSAEVRLLEQFKRVPQTATTRKLMRKYLEFCWALPFYGAAFFHGQVEQPVRGLMSLVNHKDVEVIIAVNERGVYLIDPIECTLLLGLRYEDLSWDFAKPSSNDDPECQTCIFIQFDAVENGIQLSKLMQIFSKQAAMIDALISHFAEQMRKRKQDGNASEQFHDEPNPIQNNGNGVLCNKLSRLTLATFDEEGRCIGQMGSLSISY